MKSKWVYLLFIIPVIVFFNCNIFDSPEEELLPIEGRVRFDFMEEHENYDTVCEPSIMLSMTTEEIYPCDNYSIISDVIVQNNIIYINVSGVYVPEICFTFPNFASYRHFLDITEGSYLIYLSYRDATDRYALTVNDSCIEIDGIVTQFTVPRFELFWRYPTNSFAYTCNTPIETSWIYEDFLDTLLSTIALQEFQFPDSGRKPYPPYGDGNNNPPGRYYFVKYFLYENEEDFDRAGEILEYFSKNVIPPDSGISISLIGWNNKYFYSWMLDD